MAAALPAKAADWWDQRWEARVAIKLQARAGMLKQRPVVVRWGEVARALGETNVRLSSLRLVAYAKLVPFQLDHRDRAGAFLPASDLTLDPQDELVFVWPADRAATLHLYLSGRPKPPVRFDSGVQVTSVRARRGMAHQVLSTAGLKLGVVAAGSPDPKASSITTRNLISSPPSVRTTSSTPTPAATL